MRSAPAGRMLTSMSTETVHIAIDVCVDGEEISGHAGDGVGQSRRFSGWLGLIGALDGLLVSSSAGVAQPGVHMCLGFATAGEAEAFADSPALRDAMRGAGVSGTPEIRVARQSQTNGPWSVGANRSPTADT